ncbi:site-specific integrase [Algibacter sp.]|uniref:site-specific integrase n=1 Tax=Algibacter sp. TaxID=1872428 RepID=UPI003426C583
MSVLFYLNKAKTNQKGVCPLYCRITFLKKRQQFSTGHFVNPIHWNSKTQKVSVKDVNSNFINTQLSLITQNIQKTYLKLQLQEFEFRVNDIVNLYFGRASNKEDNVLSYFKKYLVNIKNLIGKSIKESTYKKSYYVYGNVASFIKHKYKVGDIELRKLNLQFLSDFEYYLKTELNHKQITINKAIQRFRKPIRIAVAEGYLDKDPFALHKPGRVFKEVLFLSYEELLVLEKHSFSQVRLAIVRDLFVFCCYTGLAYNEMSNLNATHIIKGFDEAQWIRMTRAKTSRVINVPLLPKAQKILLKYKGEDAILPKISNQKMNSYLKEIGDIVGIHIPLTHHIARKTFASSVLLYHEVPMEIVSELLGHSSLKITQSYYGKIVNKSISQAINTLKQKL